MSNADRQIEFLARAIVNRLEDRGLVEFGDAEAGILVVIKTLEEHFVALQLLEQEARVRLARSTGNREPTDAELMNEMRRIATEKNVLL
jgi:hypothetical protein